MHYNTVIGWAVYYLIQSFQPTLPWIKCGQLWNTENCTSVEDIRNIMQNDTKNDSLNELSGYSNETSDIEIDSGRMNRTYDFSNTTSPAKEYYE